MDIEYIYSIYTLLNFLYNHDIKKAIEYENSLSENIKYELSQINDELLY